MIKRILFTILLLIFAVYCGKAELKTSELQPQAALTRADSLFRIYEFDAAEEEYFQALKFYEQAGDSLATAYPCLGIAKIALQQGFYSKSLRLLDKCASSFEAGGDYSSLSRTLMLKGEIFAKRAQYEEAVSVFSKAVSYAEKANDRSLVFIALEGLGKISLMRERFEGALNNFGRALAAANSPLDSALIYIDLAQMYSLQSDYEKAAGYLKMAKKFAATDSSALTNIYGAYADFHLRQNDYLGALQYFAQQLHLLKAHDDLYSRARVMMNIAMIYEIQKQYGKAADFMEEVVRIFDNLQSPEAKRARSMLDNLKGR